MRILRDVIRRLARFERVTELGKRVVPLDAALQRRTGGQLSVLRLFGLSSLLLSTTGRHSGACRTVPLLYVAYGREFLVVGSNWGGKRHPSWTANLFANPEATVRITGPARAVRARQLTGGELDRVWETVLTPAWPAYRDYQRWAGARAFRVFALRPTSRLKQG